MQSYCVRGPNPCTTIYQVQSGDSCLEIETRFDITSAQLRSLNPWLDLNCGECLPPLSTLLRTLTTLAFRPSSGTGSLSR